MKMLKVSFAAAILSLLALSQPAMAATMGSVTTIMGGGQLDTNWNITTSANGAVQVGTRAHDSVTGANNLVGNVYTFAVGTPWNFDFSFNTNVNGLGGNLNGTQSYSLTVSGTTILGGSITFNPTLIGDNAYGTNLTLNGGGTTGAFAPLGGSNNVMQNSEKITFAPWSGIFTVPGTYDVTASVNWNGVITSSTSQVLVGNIPNNGSSVPDGGSSAGLFMAGLTGFVALRRFFIS